MPSKKKSSPIQQFFSIRTEIINTFYLKNYNIRLTLLRTYNTNYSRVHNINIQNSRSIKLTPPPIVIILSSATKPQKLDSTRNLNKINSIASPRFSNICIINCSYSGLKHFTLPNTHTGRKKNNGK